MQESGNCVQGSEVASICQQIAAEQESAYRALYSPAYGAAKHLFITRRMERMDGLHDELKEIVGEQKAMEMTVQAMGGIVQ